MLESKVKQLERETGETWMAAREVINERALSKFYKGTEDKTVISILESIALIPHCDKLSIHINGIDTLKDMCYTSSINDVYKAIFNSVGRKPFIINNYTVNVDCVNYEVVFHND